MTRPLLLTITLAATALATGCCQIRNNELCCRENVTGLKLCWGGVGGPNSGTLLDRRPGLLTDCQGPNGCYGMGQFSGWNGYGTNGCGFGGCGHTGWIGNHGYGHGWNGWSGPYTPAPLLAPGPVGATIGGPTIVESPAYHPTPVYTTPAVTTPSTVPGQYVSPVVPMPQAYPTNVSPAPEAAAPPVIRNTYTWPGSTIRS